MTELPKHILIIPDGNRRWAQKKGLAVFLGHKEGGNTSKKIVEAAHELKIPYMTFWGCSVNNILKRPKVEVDFLFSVFEDLFKELVADKRIHENEIKVNVIGRWQELFSESTKKAIQNAIDVTKNYNKYHLNFLLAYSGLDEMTDTIKNIAGMKAENKNLEVNEELIKENLWTKNLPSVDLAIRTGGEPHWSAGCMMWDIAESQFYFTETLWPDFSVEEFKKAINKYSETSRRLGA